MPSITKSIEDYIEAIYIIEQKEKNVKSIKIAKLLNVSRPAVNRAMNDLLSLNLISSFNYSDIVLTDEGRKLAKRIYEKHLLIYDFLISIGVSKEIAEIDCCKIEHIISKETIDCMKKMLKK